MKVKMTSVLNAEYGVAVARGCARASVVLCLMSSATAALWGCGADEDASLPVCAAALCTADDEGEGAQVTVVYAPESDQPVYLSFAAPSSAVDAAGVAAGAWDLSFARTTIRLNGGSSGEGGVTAAWRDGVTLAEDEAAPSEGWVDDGADEKSLAFALDDGWYKYDLLKHEVEPRRRVYYVRATDGQTYALEMISYYSHAGEPRYPTLRWRVTE